MADGRDRKNSTNATYTEGQTSPVTGLGGLLSQAPMATPYVAAPLGAYLAVQGTKDALKGKKSNPLARLQSGITTGGFSEVARALGAGKGKTEAEDKRRSNLAKQGISLYNGDKGWEEKYNAVINPNFAKDFVGADDKGNWVNNKFASTRDESALTGKDIDKYAAWSEMFGDKWNKASDDTRYKIGDEAVKRGLLREHHGTLDVNSNDEFNSFASSLLDTPKAKSTQTGQRRETRGISPRKEDPKERRVVSRKPAPPVNLDAILPRISQPEPFVNYDNEPTQEETTNRNRYKDAILAQLMSRV